MILLGPASLVEMVLPLTSMFTVRLLVGAGVTDMINVALLPSMMLVGLDLIVTS